MDGLKCAAGFLITDDLYDPAMDTQAYDFTSVVALYKDRLPKYLVANESLIRDLQTAHDANSTSEDFVRDFKSAVKEIADERGLSFAAAA
jgi:hypothetical protein